jgi:hypothetical protein
LNGVPLNIICNIGLKRSNIMSTRFDRLQDRINDWLDECKVYVFSGEQKDNLAASLNSMFIRELNDRDKRIEGYRTQITMMCEEYRGLKAELDERFKLYDMYRKENIGLRRQIARLNNTVDTLHHNYQDHIDLLKEDAVILINERDALNEKFEGETSYGLEQLIKLRQAVLFTRHGYFNIDIQKLDRKGELLRRLVIGFIKKELGRTT